MQLTNAGHCGRCCHLALSHRNGSKGLVPELSLGFVQLGPMVCNSQAADLP